MDNLDCFILLKILENKGISTWRIANLYNWDDKPTFDKNINKNYYYVIKKGTIEYRLKRMIKLGIVEENGMFVIDDSKIKIRKVKINSDNPKLIFIKINNKWNGFEI